VQSTSQRLDSSVSTNVVFGGYSETLDQCSGAWCGSLCQLAAIGGALRFMLSRRHASIIGFDFVQTDAKDKGVDTRVAVAIPNNTSGNFDAPTIREFKVADESNVTMADIRKRSASRALDSHCLCCLRSHRPESMADIPGRGLIDNVSARNDLSFKKLRQGAQRLR
jgi:hypothetical protein